MEADGSLTKGLSNHIEKPHVLAVDDNLTDLKLVEKLLKNSSCRGILIFSNLYFLVLCPY